MATDDVNDDTPLSVMAHAYLRHNDERNSEDMKLVAEDTENDQFFHGRRYGDNDAKINSDNVADGDDDVADNVADGDDDVADENDGSPDEISPPVDDVAYPYDEVSPPDNVADGDDDVADDNDEVDDEDDDVADDNDDVDDEDDEEDDDVADDDEEEEDDENDEELTYHYIVYDQDPNNDEQIKEFYASDEIPDEVIEKIIADDYEEYWDLFSQKCYLYIYFYPICNKKHCFNIQE